MAKRKRLPKKGITEKLKADKATPVLMTYRSIVSEAPADTACVLGWYSRPAEQPDEVILLPVKSRAVSHVGYDTRTKTLWVVYLHTPKSVYVYQGVTSPMYIRLHNMDTSVGQLVAGIAASRVFTKHDL